MFYMLFQFIKIPYLFHEDCYIYYSIYIQVLKRRFFHSAVYHY